jgi:hypothetical protein
VHGHLALVERGFVGMRRVYHGALSTLAGVRA